MDDLDDMDPAELAEYKKKMKKKEEQEAEMEKLLEDIREREAEREREEERDSHLKEARLQRIKDREAREKKRAEQEMLRLKKKEEEWARKREFEEARKKEREDKLKQLQQAQQDKRASVSTGVNPLDIVKQNLEIAAAKKQQTEEEKAVKREEAVRRRCQEVDERFDRMREETLKEKAAELRGKLENLEGEKYDIEMIFKKQDYDIRELMVRINEITRRRRKTIHLGGSRRMQQDENEKSFLGVKGMVDKYVNLVAEKNKAPAKKALDLPKKQISESEDFEGEGEAAEAES